MLLIELALLPAIVLVLWIYRQDQIEKEPKGLLRKVFLWGALSVIPAVILEMLLEEVLLIFVDADTLSYLALENFIGIALVEEYCKMKAAKKVAWRHPAFNYRFAAIENVFYCVEEGFGLVVSRALLSVPSHAVDGLIMGYYFGLAKEAELAGDRRRRKRFMRRSVLMPMLTHGFYDFALSLDADWILLLFFVFVIALDIWAYRFVKKQAREDRTLAA